jgi:hypothetical protein
VVRRRDDLGFDRTRADDDDPASAGPPDRPRGERGAPRSTRV